MNTFNLMHVDSMEMEEFRDTIADNAVSDSGPLTASTSKQFGNYCSIEAIEHKMLEPLKMQSDYLLHTQAELNIKIQIIWEIEDEEYMHLSNCYSPIEMYFEDNGDGPFDDGPNSDPRDNSNWEEWLVDFGINEDPYEED